MPWKNSGGGSGAISVPSDLEFADATLPLCEAKRNTFFDDNPGRRVDKVRVILKPTGASIVLQQ
ncbi:hypothetical protein DAPPUDRAFT_280290 [Daphnia pulex]|uniref:Uncharacterized protein n=2 Tax=Daphnia pulex TaxID=6669 RepID=E9I7U8_DAPPU|nr:hypothetical protein DAPPUDRAFT_280290 [Daphnia pulex]|eukprot:EFX59932.1 hypothetical protein DAPPUDRAFT_280290 [Daphnia pulex]